MPRINRYETEFEVDGTQYVAKFKHQHFTPFAIVGQGEKIIHQTHCEVWQLVENGDQFLCYGHACCSIKDQYDWMRGIKLAFQRALANLTNGNREQWGKFNAAFFQEIRNGQALLKHLGRIKSHA